MCHPGYIPPCGVLSISNGFHVHLKLLVASRLSTSLDSKNAQQTYHISYILLFNPQQGDKQIIYSEICHNMNTFTIKFIPYRPFYSWP